MAGGHPGSDRPAPRMRSLTPRRHTDWGFVQRLFSGGMRSVMAIRAWEADTDADPMITTSVRLPKSLLDWIRQRAAAQHVRPSVLIRQWIEQQRDEDGTETAGGCVLSRARVSRFARLVAWCLVHNPGTEQADGLIGGESAHD
jgi:hypothetical protein